MFCIFGCSSFHVSGYILRKETDQRGQTGRQTETETASQLRDAQTDKIGNAACCVTLTTAVFLSAFVIASPKYSVSSPYRFPCVVIGYRQALPVSDSLQSEQNRKVWEGFCTQHYYIAQTALYRCTLAVTQHRHNQPIDCNGQPYQ